MSIISTHVFEISPLENISVCNSKPENKKVDSLVERKSKAGFFCRVVKWITELPKKISEQIRDNFLFAIEKIFYRYKDPFVATNVKQIHGDEDKIESAGSLVAQAFQINEGESLDRSESITNSENLESSEFLNRVNDKKALFADVHKEIKEFKRERLSSVKPESLSNKTAVGKEINLKNLLNRLNDIIEEKPEFIFKNKTNQSAGNDLLEDEFAAVLSPSTVSSGDALLKNAITKKDSTEENGDFVAPDSSKNKNSRSVLQYVSQKLSLLWNCCRSRPVDDTSEALFK